MSALARLLAGLVGLLPEAVLRRLPFLLGPVVLLLPGRRWAVRNNLSHAYPEKSPREIRRLARTQGRRIVEWGLWSLRMTRLDPSRLGEFIDGSALDDFWRAWFRREQGALVLLPHTALMEMATAAPVAAGADLSPLGSLYRPLGSPGLDRWLRESRARWGMRLFSRREPLAAVRTFLGEGGTLVVLADQSAGRRGILATAAGRTAAVSALPDVLARSVPADRVAVAWIERTGFLRGRLHLRELGGSAAEGTVVDRFLTFFDERVRTDPDWETDWLWMHRFWKAQLQPDRILRVRPPKQRPGREPRLYPEPGRPRADRFLLFLPESPLHLLRLLPWLRAVRRGRPEVQLWGLYPAALGSLVHALALPVDRFFPLEEHVGRRRLALRDLRALYADAAFDLGERPEIAREMRWTGAGQPFRRERGKDGFSLEEVVAFLRGHGLEEEPSREVLPGRSPTAAEGPVLLLAEEATDLARTWEGELRDRFPEAPLLARRGEVCFAEGIGRGLEILQSVRLVVGREGPVLLLANALGVPVVRVGEGSDFPFAGPTATVGEDAAGLGKAAGALVPTTGSFDSGPPSA